MSDRVNEPVVLSALSLFSLVLREPVYPLELLGNCSIHYIGFSVYVHACTN